MRASDIRPGMVLKLKRARLEAYGKNYAMIDVQEIVYRSGYKTPFIRQGDEFYRPSDFDYVVSYA